MNSPAFTMAEQMVEMLFFVFLGGSVASVLAEKSNVPDVVWFLLVGMLLGPSVLSVLHVPTESLLNQSVLLLGASFILFHGGTMTNLHVLRRMWVSVLLLSTVGVLVTAAVVAVAAHALFALSFSTAFLLGAVVASTDPASLIPIFQRYRIRERVAQAIIAESAFTDATGAIVTTVVFATLVPMAVGVPKSVSAAGVALQSAHPSIGETVSQTAHITSLFVSAAQLALGGMLVGVVIGGLTALLLSRSRSGNVRRFPFIPTPLAVVCCVLASLTLANLLHASLFMSVFVGGLTVANGNKGALATSPLTVQSMESFLDVLNLPLRILIFIFLGSQVQLMILWKYGWKIAVVTLVFLFLARPMTVGCSLLPDRLARWQARELLFFCWTRETGVLAAALIGMVTSSAVVPHPALLKSVTLVFILVTLLLQASTAPTLAKWLHLREESSG
ncbi:MAG: cation:proton antiporter [Alicyclobacillaceae bacterium]|nr:cation:proton antiporter [Alicyclobacillaceae bacterium]